MQPRELLNFLSLMEPMKSRTRHSWTSDGTHETVAAHSWRLALLSMLTAPELPDVDMDKVLKMCVLHDIGEAVTGDIPSFEKTEGHERTETQAILDLLNRLEEPLKGEWTTLFAEMEAKETPEAKAYKALDKLEAVIQHNEAELSTWLPLEYELQRTYGTEEAETFPYLKSLRRVALEDTDRKTAAAGR